MLTHVTGMSRVGFDMGRVGFDMGRVGLRHGPSWFTTWAELVLTWAELAMGRVGNGPSWMSTVLLAEDEVVPKGLVFCM